MRNYFITLFLVLLTVSCHSSKNVVNEDQIQEVIKQTPPLDKIIRNVDFYAFGYDPAWTLEIDFDSYVKFSCDEMKKDIRIPVMKLGDENELPVVNYEVNDETAYLKIQIQRNKGDSADEKPYLVNVKAKVKGEDAENEFEGKGEYFGDIRLHCKWVFEEINGVKILPADNKQDPNMEIYLEKNKVAGFLGCNTFAANIFFGRGQLFFYQISRTKKACLGDSVENKLMDVINQKKFKYTLDEDKLILKNEQTTLVLKKGD